MKSKNEEFSKIGKILYYFFQISKLSTPFLKSTDTQNPFDLSVVTINPFIAQAWIAKVRHFWSRSRTTKPGNLILSQKMKVNIYGQEIYFEYKQRKFI